MISLPNLLKKQEQYGKIQDYLFQNEYDPAQLLEERIRQMAQKKQEEDQEQNDPEETQETQEKQEQKHSLKEIIEERKKLQEEKERLQNYWAEEEAAQKARLQQMLEQSKKEAQEILDQAQQDAETMKENAEKQGYADGYEKGEAEGKEDIIQTVGVKSQIFLDEIEKEIHQLSEVKEEIISRYKDELKNLAIAVAEKVIQVSLKSSGEIMERMILSATERLKAKEWVKVYISKTDAEMMIEADRDIVKILSHLSDHIRVVAMENEKQGTCILEFPDEIIDASVDTQMENIKEILNHSGR